MTVGALQSEPTIRVTSGILERNLEKDYNGLGVPSWLSKGHTIKDSTTVHMNLKSIKST